MTEEQSTSVIFPELHSRMLENRGSQRRTAELYGCSPNWVYMVMHGRVELSSEKLDKMYNCALQAIKDIQQQAAKEEAKKKELRAAMSAKLAATS